MKGFSAGWLAISRQIRMPCSRASKSEAFFRKLNLISGAASGSADFSRTVPRPEGVRCTGLSPNAEKGCGTMPDLFRSLIAQANMLICRSGRSSRLSLRTSAPTNRPMLASGPVRPNAYCAAAISRRGRLSVRSFMVTGWLQR